MRRPGKIEQLGCQLVKQRPYVVARTSVSLNDLEALPARDIVHPGDDVQRIASAGVVTQDNGPHSSLPGQSPGKLEPDRAVPIPFRRHQIVDSILVDHGKIAPLRQGQRQHVDAAVAKPCQCLLITHVVEG
ncbi:MAG: hypothetical protein ABI647_12915 [Gemmatimonadota bacterium]